MRTGNQPAAAWKCDACGSENTGKFCQGCGAAKPAPAPAAASGWKCFCGTFNTGKFCAECGTEQYSAQDIVCSECSWTAEPGDVSIPVFCPNCGRRFDADDL
jgi:membrane protease subunit (stomatin/prohibitin family)